ncbi:MAG TPA: S46 family peptidase [Bacteroidales bacterium]|nr:S46 family peptidase [Bacteroidales bacterium]
MKKIISILFAINLIFSFNLRADEGMWLLSMMDKNYEEMKKMGFKLTPEDIYSLNNGSIKDAVVGLGNEGTPFRHFCTGEIVSAEGLFFTNHHCGFASIQSHSTIEHNYLKDGFWAYSKEEELANPGTTASILIRMEDVTSRVMAEITDDMSEEDRNSKIYEISKKISEEAIEGTYYDAYVSEMFSNNQFFLFVYVIYKDVRLVGAPPSAMGKFGGDTDNWEWPRHTADFSMFRIYTAPDGSPAEYSKDNIPLKPKHFLPVSIKDIKENDFTMIIGFPGTTERYITSYGLEETMNVTNKLRFEIRDVKIKVLREEMNNDPQIKIQYATKYARCSNYWKYSEQQNKALKKLKTMILKKDIENDYLSWAGSHSDSKYKDALGLIETAYLNRQLYAVARMYLIEGLISGPELPYFAYQCSGLITALEKKDKEMIDKNIAAIKESAEAFYKDYNAETEKKIIAAMFEYVYNNLDKQFHPDFFATIEGKYKGNFKLYVDEMFDQSVFATKEKLYAFLDKPNLKLLQKDMVMIAGISMLEKYIEVNGLYKKNSEGLDKGERLFIDGILKMNPDKLMYPDANSTIRLTYGNVRRYDPLDGVAYNYYTTLKGVIDKEDPKNPEFEVPEKLKKLYATKNYGQYVNKNNEISTCFITNNDITGGNSGSPVINGEGQLIGIAFDGNSEAMSGDIDFEENLQRCINLDIRYALFIIDKYAEAYNLLDEMVIIRD